MSLSALRVPRAGLVPGRAEGHISSAGLFFRACLLKHVVLVPPGGNLSQDKALSCTGLYFTVIVLGA